DVRRLGERGELGGLARRQRALALLPVVEVAAQVLELEAPVERDVAAVVAIVGDADVDVGGQVPAAVRLGRIDVAIEDDLRERVARMLELESGEPDQRIGEVRLPAAT